MHQHNFKSGPCSRPTQASILYCMQVETGEAMLTRCTLRRWPAASDAQMPPVRRGAVHLHESSSVVLHQCYVEVGTGADLLPNTLAMHRCLKAWT
jgi:hypothetical protein